MPRKTVKNTMAIPSLKRDSPCISAFYQSRYADVLERREDGNGIRRADEGTKHEAPCE